jgi:hypothetical protein
MKIFLRKTISGTWQPVDDEAKEVCNAFAVGDVGKFDIVKPRNYEHHKKAFALFNLVLENSDKYSTVDQILDEIKFRLGYLDHHVIDGKYVFRLKSIAFDAMGQEKFNTFYSKAIDVILKYMLPETSSDELINEIISFG